MAGLLSVGACDLGPLRVSLLDGTRFTSLFGGNGAGLLPVSSSIGVPEPLIEGESGPTLDLGLLFTEIGSAESRLIQEPFEEPESRLFSSPSFGDDRSLCLAIDHLLLILLLLSARVVRGRCCRTGGRAGEELNSARDCCLVSGVTMVDAVLGRSIGEERLRPLWSTCGKSPAFRFLEVGRIGVELSGLPNTSPAAATPTVLDATSYEYN